MLERHREPELMDDPNIRPDVHREAMIGLARINAFSQGMTMTLSPIIKMLRKHSMRSARILDLATSSGDIPFALWKASKRSGFSLSIDGCDRSSTAIQTANERAKLLGYPGNFFTLDVLSDNLPDNYDIITCSLFMHHLEPNQVVDLLRKMRQACKDMLVVNDLVRGYTNLALVSVGARILSRSPVVHFDSAASVRAAYTISEMQSLANEAGLEGSVIMPHFPCRMILTWGN